METIFVLNSADIPSYAQLETLIEANCSVQPVGSVEELRQHSAQRGVVLVGGDLEKLPALCGLVQNCVRHFSILMVLEKHQLDSLADSAINAADVLVMPATEKEIYARINAAMTISELRQLLQESAQLDEMTSLYNYHYFNKRLGEEMALSRRHLSPVTCVIISFAFYQMYLDSYGYDFIAGTLQEMGQVIKGLVRQEDIVARLGDDEIALLLPRSTEKGAHTLTKRILMQLEKIPVGDGADQEFIKPAAGIISYPTSETMEPEPDTILRYVRHALHNARCSENTNITLFSELKPQVS